MNKTVSDAEHIYGIFNEEATKEAMRLLSPNGFKLYSYMNMNQDGYQFALSFSDFHEWSGMSESTYQRCVNELIRFGYLELIEGRRYYFNEKRPTHKSYGLNPQELGVESPKSCGIEPVGIRGQILHDNKIIIQDNTQKTVTTIDNMPDIFKDFSVQEQIWKWYCSNPSNIGKNLYVRNKVFQEYGGKISDKGIEIIINLYKQNCKSGKGA